MSGSKPLADHDHPAIQDLAHELTDGRLERREKLESLFRFVRDDIRFGFPPKWDEIKASETLTYELGYCNTKATLFLALCKAVGIPARVHTGLISLDVMRGIFPDFAFRSLPDTGGHSWLEVELDGEWKPVDSYINDRRLYDGAIARLEASGRTTGFSLSRAKGPTSCEFNFGEKGFVHMGAVVEDHGAWDDVADYVASPAYGRMNRMQQMVYPWLARMNNRTIEGIRDARPKVS
jgi:transglutaminase-like putative cysteine protease